MYVPQRRKVLAGGNFSVFTLKKLKKLKSMYSLNMNFDTF